MTNNKDVKIKVGAKKLTRPYIIAVLACLALACGILFSAIPFEKPAALGYYADLFTYDEVDVKYSAAPFTVSDFDDRSGVLLTAKNQGAKTRFVNIASGDFEMDFRVLAKKYEKYDVTAMSLIFTDIDTGDAFSVEIGLTSDGLSAPTGSKLSGTNYTFGMYSYDNVRAVVNTGYGKGYAKDGGVSGITAYGQKLNSSFCNHSSGSVIVGFEPKTKNVYVKNSGSSDKMILLNIGDAEQLSATGREMPYGEFAAYSVDLEFTALSEAAEEAQAMVYSIFGREFETQQISGTDISIYADSSYKAAVNKPFSATSIVRVFDVATGQLPFDGTVTVVSPSGTQTVLKDGNYEFTPVETGFYGMTFAKGNATETCYLDVAEEADYTLSASGLSDEISVGTGMTVTLAKPRLTDDNGNVVSDARIVLTKISNGGDSEIVTENQVKPIYYTFDKAGEYTLKWTATNPFGKETVSEKKVTVSDDEPIFAGKRLDEFYPMNGIFSVPDVKASYNGKNYPTTAYIEGPDGKFSGYGNILLDRRGEYKVTYSADIDGAIKTYSEWFNAEYTADMLWTCKGANAYANTDLPEYADMYGNGVKITGVRNGATATYKNVLNLSDANLSVPFIDMMFTPEVYNANEFKRFQIRLIDAHDANNFVTLSMAPVYYNYDQSTSVICGANKNYPMAGVRGGVIHTEPDGATQFASTMRGKYNANYGVARSIDFQLYYDSNNKAFYCGTMANALPIIILDLDNEDHVGQGNAWEGFTTGEVYLEVGFFNTLNSTCSITVLEVNGQSLSGEYVKQKNNVGIVLDGYDKDNVPKAVVNKPFSLFGASLYNFVSAEFEKISNIVVYRTVGGNKTYCDIKNGAFIPEVADNYHIEYFGFDVNGNSVVRTVTIQAVQGLDELNYTFEEEIPTSAYVGETVRFAEGVVSGGSGNVKVEKYIEIGGAKYSVDNNMYTFMKSGTYTYNVKLTDYLKNTKTITKDISVSVSPTPLVTEASVPSVIMSGTTCVFPEFKAVAYDENGNKSNVPVTIKVNGTLLGEDRSYKPESLDTLTVVYEAGAWSKSFDVRIKDISSSDIFMDRYFDYSEFELTADENALRFATNAEKAVDGKAKLTFINLLPDFNMSLRFAGTDAAKTNFSQIDVYLTDSLDASIRLKMSILKGSNKEGTTGFKLNDGYERTMAGSFFAEATNEPMLLSLSGKKILDYKGTQIETVETTYGGVPFKGFPSGSVKVEAELTGITGDSELVFANIWGQPLGNVDDDYIGPLIKVDPFASDVSYGDVVDIPDIILYDVLAGKDVSCEITVNDPNGIIKDHYSGALLDKFKLDPDKKCGFKVETYGIFEIAIRAKDNRGNFRSYTTTVVVLGDVPPTLTIGGDVKTEYKVGDKLSAPKATAVDLMGREIKTYAFFVDSAERYHYVMEQEYTLSETGRFRLIYYASDEYGNYAASEFTVNVSSK